MKTLNFKLNPLPVYDDRYIKTKIRKYGDKVSINFRGINKLEDDLEFESFYNHLYQFFTYIGQQTLPSSMFRELCL